MLHRAAFDFDTEGAVEGERWLRRALGRWPDDPQVLATAMYWYARMDRPRVERAELQTWGEALGRSAQTAFQHAEHGEYLLRIAGDPEAALQSLESSLTLDATSWRTYALAGIVLADLGRIQQAIRAFQTAIALTGHAPADVRPVLQASIDELRSRARERSE